MHEQDAPGTRAGERGVGQDGDGVRSARPEGRPHSLAELVELAGDRLDAIGSSLRTLWSVRKDRAELAMRKRLRMALVAAGAAFAGGTAIIYGVVLLIGGASAGFARLLGEREWAGDLAAGALVLGLIGGGLALGLRRSDRTRLEKKKAKYAELERRKR